MRWLGPLGPCCIRRSVGFRFERLALSDRASVEKLADSFGVYFYHQLAEERSGELALSRLLLPGVVAKAPIGPRLVAAARAPGGYRRATTFVYGGSHDWMTARFGEETCAELAQAGVPAACFGVDGG